MIRSAYRAAVLTILGACAGWAQTVPPPPQAPAPTQAPTQTKPTAEMATHEEPALFKARVNLVMVPVVVRDKKGNAVGNLKQEDFQLFDKGKPQYIARFSMERAAGRLVRAGGGAQSAGQDKTAEDKPGADLPDRFIAYLFDDIHMKFGDLAHSRDAAGRHIDTALRTTDRAAIYTTSGQTIQDFTDDRKLLHEALGNLRMRPVTGQGSNHCPNMTYYMADLIVNKHDTMVLDAATLDVLSCMSMDPATQYAQAQQIAQQAAQQEINLGDHETRLAMGVIKDLVRRMAAMPGQRSIILVSNGFVTLPEHSTEKTEIMDRAIRASVLINALDARGLYTDTSDISRQGTNYRTEMVLHQMERETNRAQSDVLAELSAGTGATIFQNNNDLDAGFARLVSAPEYYYLLAFSPQNLKMDGSFHALKVTLKTLKDVSANARTGYYAPKHMENAIETAKREIEEALFSREEMSDIPVELHTQFFKSGADTARVSLIVKVDVKHLKFRKEADRNCNELTVVAGLFDRNGVYSTGNQKKIEMRLLDDTVEKRLGGGLTIRSSFDVKPGTYSVRLVVRDVEGQLMSAQNGAVEIPY
jgi:VWFA-related protein